MAVANRAWADPEITGHGRLAMHSLAHADRLELDGTWRFQLLRSPDADPGPDGWRDIAVPGCWTRQDTWDLPHYTNVQMPFPNQPPTVPALNPTGVYERTFQLPGEWPGRRIVLHVGAAESVLFVTLNGVEVGLSKDSHLAAEFEVTHHVRAGENHLRLVVVKWSDASFVEDQDQWWHGGITRSVFLYTTAPVHLADVDARSGLAGDGRTGTLRLTVDIGFGEVEPAAGWTVEARVPGLAGTLSASTFLPEPPPWPLPAEPAALWRRHAVGGDAAVADQRAAWDAVLLAQEPALVGRLGWDVTIPDVAPWTAEASQTSASVGAMLKSPTTISRSVRARSARAVASRAANQRSL